MLINNPENILIIRLSAIGDVINVLPALKLLRSQFPDAKITWLVEDRASEILRNHPDVDEIIIYPRKKWQRGILKVNKSLDIISESLAGYSFDSFEYIDLRNIVELNECDFALLFRVREKITFHSRPSERH